MSASAPVAAVPPPSTAAPLVSVALCTFNGERHLREQLDSLLAQDWPSLEIVAIDDASTDGTPGILAEYARLDARIRYSRNAVNLGYEKNFEHAILQCKGQWIAPCDQDDIWQPDKISVLAAELQRSRALLAWCDSELIDERGQSMNQRLSERMHRFSTEDPVPFLLANAVTGHALLFCRSLVATAVPFPPRVFHDWWLAYVAVSAGRIQYVDRCLVRYRQHAQTLTDITGSRPSDTDRSRGFRHRELAQTAARLAQFARVPGKGQAFAGELLRLWRQRESAFVSHRLALFMLRHRERLWALQHSTPRQRLRRSFQFFWGLRTKRLFEPQRYANLP